MCGVFLGVTNSTEPIGGLLDSTVEDRRACFKSTNWKKADDSEVRYCSSLSDADVSQGIHKIQHIKAPAMMLPADKSRQLSDPSV
jgi:hypothetical protein